MWDRATTMKEDAANSMELCELGLTHGEQGEHREALRCYLRALAIEREADRRESVAQILYCIGALYQRCGDYKQALDYLRESLSFAEGSSEQQSAPTLGAIGEIHLALGNTAEAEDAINHALALARESGDSRAVCAASIGNARLCAQLGRYGEARSLSSESLGLARDVGDLEQEIACLVCASELHLVLGEQRAAAGCVQRARDLNRVLGSKCFDSRLHQVLGRTATEPADALELLNRAVDLAAETEDLQQRGEATLELAHLMSDEQALQLYNEALSISRELQSGPLEARVTLAIAELYLRRQAMGEALEHCRLSLRLASEIQMPDLLWRDHLLLGEIHRLAGDYQTAASEYETAKSVLRDCAGRLPDEATRSAYLQSNGRERVEQALQEITESCQAEPAEAQRLGTLHRAAPPDDIESLASERHKLTSLYRASRLLVSETGQDRFFDAVIDGVLAVTGAERASLLLVSEEGSLACKAAKDALGARVLGGQLQFSHSIAEKVIRTARPLYLRDVLDAREFEGKRSVADSRLRSVICLPVKIRQPGLAEEEGSGFLEVAGVIYADTTKRGSAFRILARDFEILELLAGYVAMCIERMRLRDMAHRDALTRVYTRRYFETRLAEEIKRSHRYGFSVSLAMLDVDHFKDYNDAYGHHSGDKVLRDLAAQLRGAVREVDVLGRYGGDEFAIILPDTDAQGSLALAERLREQIEHYWQDEIPPLTVSIGLTCHRGNQGTNPEELMMKADAAMYEAKNRGGNQVCCD